MVNTKDVLLAILVAYVILDIAAAVVMKRSRPMLFNAMMESFRSDRNAVLIALVLAVAGGFGTYYLAKRM